MRAASPMSGQCHVLTMKSRRQPTRKTVEIVFVMEYSRSGIIFLLLPFAPCYFAAEQLLNAVRREIRRDVESRDPDEVQGRALRRRGCGLHVAAGLKQ